MYHANVCLILESLHRECSAIPLYSREGFLRKCVCNMEDLDCVSNSCKQSKDGKLLDTVFSQYKSDKNIHWAAWGKSENGFLTKDTVEGTVQEALNVLKNQLSKFIWHAFIKGKQATSYQIDKEESTAPESEMCLLQMDFAQNYSCLFQDEIVCSLAPKTDNSIYDYGLPSTKQAGSCDDIRRTRTRQESSRSFYV